MGVSLTTTKGSTMTKVSGLSREARQIIKSRGYTAAQYVEAHCPGAAWSGDTCGCPDDRCRDGFHHEPGEECGCLSVQLDDLDHWRRAADIWRRHHDGVDVQRDLAEWARFFGHGIYAGRVSGRGIDLARSGPNPGWVGSHDHEGGGYWLRYWSVTDPPGWNRPQISDGEVAALQDGEWMGLT